MSLSLAPLAPPAPPPLVMNERERYLEYLLGPSPSYTNYYLSAKQSLTRIAKITVLSLGFR